MSSSAPAVAIVAVEDRKTVGDWLAVPYAVFADDPAWVAPLNFLERRRISRKHAPFFTFGEARFFLAYRGGRPVGRISAQINRRHLERYRDDCGHFGFFDCQNDPDAAQALVGAAADWLRGRGMSRMVGPMNLSVNEECGCLVSGFDTAPAVLMTHARKWTGSLLEAAGLTKKIDLYAYRLTPGTLPRRVLEIAETARRTAGVSIRHFNVDRYADEVRTLIDIFNDAWSENWGFVPFSAAEIDALLAELRPLFRDHYGRFVLFNDVPVGFMLGMPNVNQAIAPFAGRLLPFNWLKLWWTLKREGIPTARVPLLGIAKAYQSTPMGGMLLALIISEFIAQMRSHNLEWVEFSWILETNKRMNNLARFAAGPPVKTYRIYGKSLQRPA
jgi:hypothetical protein